MRMVEDNRSHSLPAYRIMNEHTGDVMVVTENAVHQEKGATDEDDEEDLDVVSDADISRRSSSRRRADGESSASPGSRMEHDKRLRREIANSNERRRMQSINAGFQSLKALLPRRDGEKMSKASILQHTADFIRRLQLEKDLLVHHSGDIKQQFGTGSSCVPKELRLSDTAGRCSDGATPIRTPIPPPKKRKKFENDSADEGVAMLSDVEALRMSPHFTGPYSRTFKATWTQTESSGLVVDASCCTSPSSEGKTMETSMLIQDKMMEVEVLQRQLTELRVALDRERRVRLLLEEQIRMMELTHLQALPRLQPVPFIGYNSPQQSSTYSPLITSTAPVSTPRELAPSAASAPAPPFVPVSVESSCVPTAISSPTIPIVPQPSAVIGTANGYKPASSPAILPIKQCGQLPPSSPASVSSAKSQSQSNAANGAKQSLAAIVEAIRHLEGDQLFVDVQLHRPVTQMVNGRFVATMGGHCKNTPCLDHTDSGISSPAGESK